MRRVMLMLTLACVAAPGLGGAGGLPEGRYRVAVHVVLPNVETRNYDFATEVCWRGPDDPGMPLGPVGPGPLASCPSKAQETPDGVVVTTSCGGPNAGSAVASYRRTAQGFTGRIEIDLGGKNMTMAELQHGVRVGPCELCAPGRADPYST